MATLRTWTDVKVDDDYAETLAESGEEVAETVQNLVHTVAIDGMPIPEEAIRSNKNPSFGAHIHEDQGSGYCLYCRELARDV